MKRIAILGSTGSIGVNTLDVIAAHPDAFRAVGLSARTNAERLIEQVRRFRPAMVTVGSAEMAQRVRAALGADAPHLLVGVDGLRALAADASSDGVVIATSGSDAVLPLIDAIRAGKQIALANKESIVMAGEVIRPLLAEHGSRLIPVDSEHNALFQCLEGREPSTIGRVYLTGSGGPLREMAVEELPGLTIEQVLNHPKWKMGRKITVDSATLMNKGLELIEARWLFNLPLDRIHTLIHPEALIHAMVEFTDGMLLAALGPCDMRLPIQYALSYPRRLAGAWGRLDFSAALRYHFLPPDTGKFPCLRLAREAAQAGGTMPAILNAANEEAVQAFLAGSIRFVDIPTVIERTLSAATNRVSPTLDDIFAADRFARETAREALGSLR
ncbi:MAG: 1-deoxy-D-xylulose-5-phosphate reductoisomerase [Candidatus Omnitrophica bacterium]|nr:1-deoxy-D-xylulose-5-phosphate reductoisomerase [Candidatus Omnitrophota bacterium]